ncbi:MAG: hypothetical protein Q3980_00955 [Turicibacter sp.]|nr:hypothetical protein [Turicibacter sp.]
MNKQYSRQELKELPLVQLELSEEILELLSTWVCTQVFSNNLVSGQLAPSG